MDDSNVEEMNKLSAPPIAAFNEILVDKIDTVRYQLKGKTEFIEKR